MKTKEIIVFTNGDSSNIDVWSNVPYMLTNTMETFFGIKVHRINVSLETSWKITKCTLSIINEFIIRLPFNRNSVYDVYRTPLYYAIVKRKIRNAIKRFPKSYAAIIIGFSYTIKSKNFPICNFCDWSIGYHIEKQLHREPMLFEKIRSNKEHKILEKADYVLSLYPDARDYLEEKCKRKVYYFGNAINSKLIDFDINSIVDLKIKSNHILFIGGKKYHHSALVLIRTVLEYNRTHANKLFVDVIGFKQEQISYRSKYLNCYGYLSKKDEHDRKIYYDLLFNAKAIVNVNEEWNGMSSLIEAMYYCTPIIVVPNDNIIKTLGENNYGFFVNHCNEKDVLLALDSLNQMTIENYYNMCVNAHNSVRGFTWNNFVQHMLQMFDTYYKQNRKSNYID